MKLVVSGATGFVATEVIRQSLSIPAITSVIALARRPVGVPDHLDADADTSKLHSVVLEDFAHYPEEVRRQLAGADACIWTLAITPTKSRSVPWDQVHKVCNEYTMSGLEAIVEARGASADNKSSPLRFLYMSGVAAERDQTKNPTFMPQYCLMRGETENQVLAYASSHETQLEASVAKPGLIGSSDSSILSRIRATVLWYGMSVPSIDVVEISAAMLDQVINGFEKDPLENADLVRIGKKVLADRKA